MKQYDVIIVGLGPTGGTLANLLALNGFSILILSNFIPTIYFGVFTGIAMLLAMISVLTLLPKLLLIYKPFNKEINKLI